MFNEKLTTAKDGWVALRDWDGNGDKDLIDLCNEICQKRCGHDFGTREELAESEPMCAGAECPICLPSFYAMVVKLAEYEAKGGLADFQKALKGNLNNLAKEIHENARAHGWWDEERTFSEIIALCHSELSEALEEYRNEAAPLYYTCKHSTYGQADGYICEIQNEPDAFCSGNDGLPAAGCKYAKPEGIATELADCIIRILDYCGAKNIDIAEAVRVKHEYNKSRPFRHGGKKI